MTRLRRKVHSITIMSMKKAFGTDLFDYFAYIEVGKWFDSTVLCDGLTPYRYLFD